MGLKIEGIGKPGGSTRSKKRKGRGMGSGLGKTAGRGHKGAKARSGGGKFTPGFEGGQMPLVRRIPKRGFTSKFKKKWNIVNINLLQRASSVENGGTVDKNFLIEHQIIRKKKLPVKILGKGKLEKALTVRAQGFSSGAKTAIEDSGGKAEVVK